MSSFSAILLPFTRYRQLTWEMTRREISDRYAGQALGTFWAVGHPLAQMGVYIFVFAFVFKARATGAATSANAPLDYISYLLSGLIPWIAFQESMAKASTVIRSNANLVKQVVFPIEILPVKGVFASMLTQGIMTLLLLIYIAISRGGLPWTVALLPLLLASQAFAMIGASWVLGAVGVFLRDTKDLVQLSNLIGVYLVPIAYLPAAMPAALRPILFANPFSYMAWCFQDALYHGTITNPAAWLVFPLGSVLTMVLGFRLFSALKLRFGNVL
jgi:lipopolysaccharide transport system permease protein